MLAALLAAPPAAPAKDPVTAVAVERVVLRTNTTLRRSLRTARVDGLLVRARGDRCRGYPRLRISVDGRRAQKLTLTRQWRDYQLPLKLKAGRHVVRVVFSDDRSAPSGRCSRAVRIAQISFIPGATRRVPLGSAVNLAAVRADPAYADAALREFDSYTPENEMKMAVVEPEPGDFAFAAADELVDWALRNGKEIHGHALVFDKQTPAWVARFIDPNQVAQIMRDYIRAVMTRYRGRVREWDVVNEAFDGNGHYRNTFWYQRLGPRFVELAFQFARQTDPTARLYYNEYGAELAGPQRDAVYNLVAHLKSMGLIDGVGLQMHTALQEAPTQDQLEDTMRHYQALGLDVQITEMDVLAKRDGTAATLDDRLDQQAAIYAAAARACEAVSSCARFTVWGVGDKYSWLGADQLPLLLDVDFRPKPALAAVQFALGH